MFVLMKIKMHIPHNKDQIKTDKISEKLSGKEQFADNIVDSLLKARINTMYPLKIGRTNPR